MSGDDTRLRERIRRGQGSNCQVTKRILPEGWTNVQSPGSYQRLDLFIQVLRVLCPNLTDASLKRFLTSLWLSVRLDTKT